MYDRNAISEKAPLAIPKRIIVCCDGTWQSATSLDPTKGCESNVTRLCRAVAKSGSDPNDSKTTWQQIVYYDAGVGTGDITGFEKKRQGGLGKGLVENVIEAYNFIVSNYSPGDELFFFGFSRGAFTVRSAAGLVSAIGVIKPCYMPVFIRCYAAWMEQKDLEGKALPADERHKKFTEYKPWIEFTNSCEALITRAEDTFIQVIGVWDTVGSLGVPSVGHWITLRAAKQEPYEFHDLNLNNRILHAYQALALDERRGPFEPTLWKLRRDTSNPNTERKTYLCQCWFPGAHINVGGGSSANADPSKATGDQEQLASISYAWMLDRIRPHLALDEDALNVQFGPFVELADHARNEPAKSQGWMWDKWADVKNYVTGASNQVTTGYARGHIDDSFTMEYYVMGLPKDRTPGKYHNVAEEYTVERIHPSVFFRQQARDVHGDQIYNPAALRGWTRIEQKNGLGRGLKARKGWMWVKYVDPKDPSKGYGSDCLWEFQIGNMPDGKSLEKRLMKGSWVDAINEKVAEGWNE